MVQLGPSLALAGAPTAEPSLDGARIVATGRSADLYAGRRGGSDGGGRIELRRLVCR